MTELSADELDLLQWLGEAELSQYGECYGSSFDALLGMGLVEILGRETERNNPFIAKGSGMMYRAVRLTAAGRERLKQ